MEIKDKTIALLIDSDNISQDYFAILLDELSNFGRVTYKRLYGDFSKPQLNGWKSALLEHSIEQIQQIAYTTGKNATDSSMIIDAMDILYKGKVDCFCLATSDSDFTGLARRFRNDNLIVIGAGEEKTPNSFRKACDRFILIDELLKAKNGNDSTDVEIITEKIENSVAQTSGKPASAKQKAVKKPNMPDTKRDKLIKMTTKTIVDNADSDGWMHFAAFMNEIYRKENEFNPKLYGHTNSSASSFFKILTNKSGKLVFSLEKNNNIDRIKLNK